jgi:hypothetical protein
MNKKNDTRIFKEVVIYFYQIPFITLSVLASLPFPPRGEECRPDYIKLTLTVIL